MSWELIETKEFSSPATSYTFANLDSNSARLFRLLGVIIGGATDTYLYLRPNADPTNRPYVSLRGVGGAVGSSQTSLPAYLMSQFDSNEHYPVDLIFNARPGRERVGIIATDRTRDPPYRRTRLLGSIWANTIDNITSLQLLANKTNGIGAGSWVMLLAWKPSSWWNTDWTHRFKYTILNDNLPDGESLVDFPLHIDLTNDAPAGFWSHVKSDGSDIRVVDRDGIQLTGCHLEGWDYANHKGHLWVKKTIAQDTGSNTDFVYVYYGNAGAAADWDKEGTYNTGYKAVWHLDESTGHYLDATANGNDSTAEQVTSQTATGRINGCPEFDGAHNYIEVPDSDSLSALSALTIKALFKRDENTGDRRLVSKWTPNNQEYRTSIRFSSGKFRVGIYGKEKDTSGTDFTAGVWVDVAVTWDGSNQAKVYKDGALYETLTLSNVPSPTNKTSPFVFGKHGSSASEYWDGLIDEVRISDVARSAEWIAFAYLSDKGDAGTAGAEEQQVPAAAQPYSFIM